MDGLRNLASSKFPAQESIAHTQEEVTWLVTEIEKLKPFPDAVAALEKFRSKGYKLTILSNSDRDMLKTAGAAAVVWLAKSVSIA